jgi:hypothetical protein
MDLMSDRGLLAIAVLALGAVAVGGTVGIPGVNLNTAGDTNPDMNGDTSEFDKFKETVGIKFPSLTNGETYVLISDGVSAENFGSQDVTDIGADSDESDETELFASEDVEEGEDYYMYTTGGSQITTNVPNSGDFQLAVIGSGVVNEYTDVSIPDRVQNLRVEQGTPVSFLDGDSATAYATDAYISNSDTRVEDGDSTIALTSDFSSANDADVDGSVTLVDEYEVTDNYAASFGEVSVSSVNTSNVDEVTVSVMVDGQQVITETDSDFSDSEGLDDGIEFGPEIAEDSFEVSMDVEFDDSAVTTATNLATVTLDDTDEDGVSSDGSYGASAVTSTLTGY